MLALMGFSALAQNNENEKYQQFFSVLQQESDGYLLGFQFHDGSFSEVLLNDNTILEIGVLTDQTAMYRNVEIPIFIRHKLAKNLFMFYGGKFQNLSGIDGSRNLTNSQNIFLEMGLQYEATRNLILELRSSFMLNPSNKTYPYNINNTSKNLLRLGAGYKF